MTRLFNDVETENRLLAEFDARRRQQTVYRQQATPDQVSALADVHRVYPYAAPGVKYAIAASGIPVDSAEAKELADASGAQVQAQGQLAQPGQTVNSSWFEENIWSPAKAAVRTVATVGQGLYHEAGRVVSATLMQDFGSRNNDSWQEAYNAIGDSPMLRAVKSDLAGTTPDDPWSSEEYLGAGFLPGGKIQADHRAQIDKLRGQFGGDFSPGRVVAKRVHLEPGSRAFNVTSGLLDLAGGIFLDPTSKATNALSKVDKARRTFGASADLMPRTRAVLEKAQIIGPRRSTVASDVDDYLLREQGGRQLVEWLTDTADPAAIWRGMGRKIDRDLAVDLADADTTGKVHDVLRGVLGTAIPVKPDVGQAAMWWRTSTFRNNIRLLGQMPGDHLEVDDLTTAMTQLDDFLLNAKVPTEVRNARLSELARIDPDAGDKVTRVWSVAKSAMADVTDQLSARGRPLRKELTKLVEDYETEFRRYFVDEVGGNVAFPGSKAHTFIGGRVKELPTAHLLTEYADTVIPLPDARTLRRELSAKPTRMLLDAYDKIPLVNTASLENLMTRVWKPMQLIRGAWVVRVIGEEQVRMGAQGLDSAFSHPLSWVGWLTGRKGSVDVRGNPLEQAQEFTDAMSRGAMGFLDDTTPGHLNTGMFTVARKGDENYMRGVSTELNQLWNDPVAQVVAGAPVGGTSLTRDAVKQWFWDGDGKKFRETLGSSPGKADYLTDRAVADAYIDSVWRRIEIKTGNDQELIDAIATGDLRGTKVRFVDSPLTSDPKVMKAWRSDVNDVLSEKVPLLPDEVKAPYEVKVPGRRGKDMARLDKRDRAIDVIFGTLMSKPTNYLSRSPAFRQQYWDEMARLMPWMDEATQQATFAGAAKAGLDDGRLMKMRRTVDNPSEVGDTITDLAVADELAKGKAVDGVKGLLYDLSNRSQFSDVTRLIFPFAEAWKEVMTTWARLGMERPQNLRRAQQVIQSGFFQPNDRGEETFNYPLGWLATKAVAGVPDSGAINLQGRAEGLNLVTQSFVPGFGPVIQMPASVIIPDDDDFKGFMQVVLPFGREDFSGGVIESQLPAWAQRLYTAVFENPESDRLYGNTVGDVMRTLAASGEYGQDGGFNPDELQRLYTDAKGKARNLYFLRAAAQFVLPTGPQLEFSTTTDAGAELIGFETLRDEYAAMGEDTAAGGWDTAFERFVDKHGMDVALVLQGKTKVLKEHAWTAPGMAWQRAHPELVSKYGNTIGFFAPEGADAQPEDYEDYMSKIRSGVLEPLSPEEMLRLSNHRIASNVYDQARTMMGDSINDPERQVLRDLSEALRREYPGYGDTYGVANAANLETRIGELERAAADPALAGSDTAAGIRAYMQGRAAVKQRLEAAGLTSLSSTSAAQASTLLRQLGEAIVREHPGFDRVWNDVFAYELGEEPTVTEEAA